MFDPQCIESYKFVTSKAEISVTKSPLQPPNQNPKCRCRHTYASACVHMYITDHAHAYHTRRGTWAQHPETWWLTLKYTVSWRLAHLFHVFLCPLFISSSSSSPPRAIAVLLPLHWLQAILMLLLLAFPVRHIMSREEKGAARRESRTDLSMRNYSELRPWAPSRSSSSTADCEGVTQTGAWGHIPEK